MSSFLFVASLACQTGFALVDWSGRFPAGLHVVDAFITVRPFYSRLIIYPQLMPDQLQRCCGDKTSSVIRLPVGNGRFCISQSQPGMKWKMQVILRPDVAL
jgi:hypothetical protein